MRKRLAAVVLSILKCVFYSCHLSGVGYRDGVGPSPKGGGAGSARLNPPLVDMRFRLYCGYIGGYYCVI